MDGENLRQKLRRTNPDFSDDKKSPYLEQMEFPFPFSASAFFARLFPFFFPFRRYAKHQQGEREFDIPINVVLLAVSVWGAIISMAGDPVPLK